MRIINVIETTPDDGILSIESFGIFEEQLSQEVVEKAEELFLAKCRENGALNIPDGEEDALIDGYFDNGSGYYVTIIWSNI